MYSLKYGTVPIVRATGGLEDSVEEWNAEAGTGTGFKFYGYNPQDLLAAIDRALTGFSGQGGLAEADAEWDGEGLCVGASGAGVC
jgi:glycogen synthase